jgi:hypothetical protein
MSKKAVIINVSFNRSFTPTSLLDFSKHKVIRKTDIILMTRLMRLKYGKSQPPLLPLKPLQ